MNISGSDVSKEAANMILLGEESHFEDDVLFDLMNFASDDNFASTISKYICRIMS